MTPEVWSETVELQSYHCDRTDHLSLWGLCRLFQEASAHHTDGSPIGYVELLEQQKGWVLTRMYYEMRHLPSMRDCVKVSTWSRGSNGLIAVREFDLRDSEGRLLASASTQWVVIDMVARRVCLSKDWITTFPYHQELATSKRDFSKLRLPAFTDEELVAVVPANDSLIDHTHHVNNAEYLRLMNDYLDTTLLQPIADGCSRFDGLAFQIDYLLETKPGDTLRLFRRQEADAVSFQIGNTKGISTTAQFFRI